MKNQNSMINEENTIEKWNKYIEIENKKRGQVRRECMPNKYQSKKNPHLCVTVKSKAQAGINWNSMLHCVSRVAHLSSDTFVP